MSQRGIALREWRLSRSDYLTDDEFRAAVQGELAQFEHIGERLGIALVAAPIRTRALPDGDYFTAGWLFKTATVPAAGAGIGVEALDAEMDAIRTEQRDIAADVLDAKPAAA